MDTPLPDLATQPADVQNMCEALSVAQNRSVSEVWDEIWKICRDAMDRKNCDLPTLWSKSRGAMKAADCKDLYEGLLYIRDSYVLGKR